MTGKTASVTNGGRRCLFARTVPEEVVQGPVQSPADGDAQPDGGVVVPLFNGVDGLTGDTCQIGQSLLAEALGRTGGAEAEVLHSESTPRFSRRNWYRAMPASSREQEQETTIGRAVSMSPPIRKALGRKQK